MRNRSFLLPLSIALASSFAATNFDTAIAKTGRSLPSAGDLKTESNKQQQQQRQKQEVTEADKISEREARHLLEEIKVRIRNNDTNYHDLESKLRSYPSVSVRLILDAMDTNDDSIRVPMSQVLSRIANNDDYYFSSDSLKTIIGLLKACPQRDVKTSLLGVLGSIGPRNDDIKAAIVYALKISHEPSVKRAAIEALSRVSQQERPALHRETAKILLLELANDESPALRAAAAQALTKFHSNSDIVVPALVKALDDNYLNVRNAACQALSGYQGEAKPAVAKLIETLKTESDQNIRYSAMNALQNIDKSDPQILSVYVDLLDDPSLGRNAIGYLTYFAENAAPAVPKLIAILKNGDRSTKHQAAIVLSNIGPGAKEALPALTEALKDGDAQLVRYAGQAINRINQTTE